MNISICPKNLSRRAELTTEQKQAIANYEFHSSSVGLLLGRGKDKILTDTAMSYLDDKRNEILYSIKTDFSTYGTKFTEKGTENEKLARLDVAEYLNLHWISGEKIRVSNGYITGESDINIPQIPLTDIKCCWDKSSFDKKDGKERIYYVQLKCYKWLYGRLGQPAWLFYVLTDTPEYLLTKEKNKALWGIDFACDEYANLEKQIERNNTFSDLPLEVRVKHFEYGGEDDEEVISEIKTMVEVGRLYMLGELGEEEFETEAKKIEEKYKPERVVKRKTSKPKAVKEIRLNPKKVKKPTLI